MAIKRKLRRPQKPHCLLPSLHGAVSDLLEEDDLYFGFHGKDDPIGCVIHQDTTFQGTFVCRNDACRLKGRRWVSSKIAITIRMYPGAEYNARLYKQRCMKCSALGDLVLDRHGSYADMVAYQIKKWYGLDVVPPEDDIGSFRRERHRRKLCEGCRVGHCKMARKAGFDGDTTMQ